jgi:glutathione S-transferase
LSKRKYLAGDELSIADLWHLPYGVRCIKVISLGVMFIIGWLCGNDGGWKFTTREILVGRIGRFGQLERSHEDVG